ncbi:MAG: hypothetical protein QXJ59_04420 [Thermofilaceae archaeon]
MIAAKTFEEVVGELLDARRRENHLKDVLERKVPLDISMYPGEELVYAIELRVPRFIADLAGVPRAAGGCLAKSITVRVDKQLEVEVKCKGGVRLLFSSTRLGDLLAILLLWREMKKHGIDFLDDVRRVFAERAAALELLIEKRKAVEAAVKLLGEG